MNGLRAVIYRFERFHVDTDTFSLSRDEVAMRIDPQEFDVLVYLIERRDRVVTRDELFASLWQGKVVSESALSSRLKAVRRALDDSGANAIEASYRLIQALHGLEEEWNRRKVNHRHFAELAHPVSSLSLCRPRGPHMAAARVAAARQPSPAC